MSQPISEFHAAGVSQYIVRSPYGMFLLSEPSDGNALKVQTAHIAALAWRLKCEWSQWVFDDGVDCRRLFWLGCPRGDDIQLFEKRLHDVIGHFKIMTYASIKLMADCVSVSLHQNGKSQVWFSPGELITLQWEQHLLSQLLGGQNNIAYLRQLHAHEVMKEPQTNAGKMARQLKAKQLWRDLGWHETSVL